MNKPINICVRFVSSPHFASFTTKDFVGKLFLRRKKQRKNVRQKVSLTVLAGIERDRGGGTEGAKEISDGRYLARAVREVLGGVGQWAIIVQLCPV